MYNKKLYAELEKELRKLNRFVAVAVKNGVPICQYNAILVQNQKVDALIVRIQEAMN